jgi:hypothetical protein
VSNSRLYEELVAAESDMEVYNIGDSVEPREIDQASHEEAEVAELIRRGRLRRRQAWQCFPADRGTIMGLQELQKSCNVHRPP